MTGFAGRGFTVIRVAWDDPRAVALRDAMDAELQPRYAGSVPDDDAARVALAVDPSDIAATVLAVTEDGAAVGHAALRRLGPDYEVKRVIVDSSWRGRGLGRLLMAEIETVGREQGATRLILQTGDRQPDAVAMYRQLGYTPIPIYQPYVQAIPFSLCFEKSLGPGDVTD
jgi:GNAT superfamily N-acetyltransferase